MVNFGEFFENLKLAVKQCYQTCQFVKDKNWLKMLICDILGNFQTLCPFILEVRICIF